jgi:hypothetical protein
MFEHYKHFPAHVDSLPKHLVTHQLPLYSALSHHPPMVVRRPPTLVTTHVAPSMFPPLSTSPHGCPTTRAPPLTRDLPQGATSGNLSQAINSVGRTLLFLRKRAPDTTPNPAEWSAGPPPSFSPNIIIKAVMKPKNLLTIGYISLLGP